MLLEEITESTATDTFRCDALSCRMSGAACAKTHVLARRTMDVARRVCVFCPLGARRATLLKIGEPLCRAVDQGTPCQAHALLGSKYCAAHSHRGVAPKVRLDVAPAFFTSDGQDWEADLPEPTRPVAADLEVAPQSVSQAPQTALALEALPPLPPEIVCACGEPYCLGRKRKYRALPACAKCVKRAVSVCVALGEPLLEESVRGRLWQDPPKKTRGVCARCGASTPPSAVLCPICVTNVVKVFWVRFARRISRQEAQTAYLELPPKRQYTSRKTKVALNCAP